MEKLFILVQQDQLALKESRILGIFGNLILLMENGIPVFIDIPNLRDKLVSHPTLQILELYIFTQVI